MAKTAKSKQAKATPGLVATIKRLSNLYPCKSRSQKGTPHLPYFIWIPNLPSPRGASRYRAYSLIPRLARPLHV